MAWTARDVTLRMRREFGDERLVVRFDPIRERFSVCQRVRRLTGRRHWPVELREDGSVVPGGPTTIREVVDDEEVILYLEDPSGAPLPLDPCLVRQELLERDVHLRGDVVAEMIRRVNARRAEADRRFEDEVGERSKHYRRAFARAAENMGI